MYIYFDIYISNVSHNNNNNICIYIFFLIELNLYVYSSKTLIYKL